MSIKQQIDADLKTAMLSGDKVLVTTLRGLKSAILYVEVSEGSRDEGLSDDKIISLLQKESKKRQESADLYEQGGNIEKKEAELKEKSVIEKYLPEQLSDEELIQIIEKNIEELGNEMQKMGLIISKVKQDTAGRADGGTIAKLVKERLG